MKDRLELHAELKEVTGYDYLYFQPPKNTEMSYPCVRYNLSTVHVTSADNKAYVLQDCYEVILITKKQAMDVVHRLLEHFPKISPGNFYVADNLYHYPFKLYY